MNINEMFPSRFVKAENLNGRDVTVTIARVTKEQVEPKPGEKELKPVLHFQNATKGLLLNKTNGLAIADLHGDETDDWTGKRITLYPTTCQAFGKTHNVIRVRPTVPPDGNGEQAQAAAEATTDPEDWPPDDF